MTDLGRTSALRSPRQCTRIDEGAGLRPLAFQRFIGARKSTEAREWISTIWAGISPVDNPAILIGAPALNAKPVHGMIFYGAIDPRRNTGLALGY